MLHTSSSNFQSIRLGNIELFHSIVHHFGHITIYNPDEFSYSTLSLNSKLGFVKSLSSKRERFYLQDNGGQKRDNRLLN